jgi:hypothetical protein
MPKLEAAVSQKVANAETTGGGEYTLIEPGRYFATLTNVDVREGKYGPQWSAEFSDIHDAKGMRQPGRQWYNLNVPVDGHMHPAYQNGEDKWAKFQDVNRSKMKQFFEAFGYTTDSDTDEMVGEKISIDIEIRTIQSGPRTGERVNSVKNVHPVTNLAGGTVDEAPF